MAFSNELEAQWQALIEKEQKGKHTFQTLRYLDEQDINLAPFYHGYPPDPPSPLLRQSALIYGQSFITPTNELKQLVINTLSNDIPCLTVSHYAAEVNVISDILRINRNLIQNNTQLYLIDQPISEQLLDFLATANNLTIPLALDGDVCWRWLDGSPDATNFWEEMKQIFSTKDSPSLIIRADLVENCGGTGLQALVYALVAVKFYVQQGIKPEKMIIRITGNQNFLGTIAKIRALKRVLGLLSPTFEAVTIAFTSGVHALAKVDTHTNLVRLTSQAMTGIIGGADVVDVLPYNIFTDQTTEDTLHLSRNILHILHYESQLDFVNDPLAGAYSIEVHTDQLVKATLYYVNTRYDFPNFFKGNQFISEINQARDAKLQLFNAQQLTVIGVNKYQNKNSEPTPNKNVINFNIRMTNRLKPLFFEP